jgi:hypothetical protein
MPALIGIVIDGLMPKIIRNITYLSGLAIFIPQVDTLRHSIGLYFAMMFYMPFPFNSVL